MLSTTFYVPGCLPSVYVVGNMDLKQTAPKVEHYITRLHQARQHLFHMWNVTKAKLEQCLQLRLFEQDCEDVRTNYMYLHKLA